MLYMRGGEESPWKVFACRAAREKEEGGSFSGLLFFLRRIWVGPRNRRGRERGTRGHLREALGIKKEEEEGLGLRSSALTK